MAGTLDELLAQYQAQQAQSSSMAKQLGGAAPALTAAASGVTGLVGAVAAPIAARFIGDAFGLNKRSAAEEAALNQIRNVAQGGSTAAQAALEYQRARTGRMATQAAAMGPARERAARQLVGQEQNIAAQQDITGQLAQVKMQEQARAQQAVADIETRAAEAERQRQRQMVAGAVTGGLGALSQAYGGYLAGKQRATDLQAQAKGAQAAINTITEAQQKGTPTSVAEKLAAPMTEAGKSFVSERQPGTTSARAALASPAAAGGGAMLGEEDPLYQLGGARRPSRIRTFGGSY